MQGWARLTTRSATVFHGVREGGGEARPAGVASLASSAGQNSAARRPIDPARFAISDADIASLLRAAREAPGDAAAGPDRDDADGG